MYSKRLKQLEDDNIFDWESSPPCTQLALAWADLPEELAKQIEIHGGFCGGLIRAAVKFDNVRSLEVAMQYVDPTEHDIIYAAKRGSVISLEYMLSNSSGHVSGEAVNKAALNGHLSCIVVLHRHEVALWCRATIEYASYGGHIDIVRYLTNYMEPGTYDPKVCISLCHMGAIYEDSVSHAACLKYLCSLHNINYIPLEHVDEFSDVSSDSEPSEFSESLGVDWDFSEDSSF